MSRRIAELAALCRRTTGLITLDIGEEVLRLSRQQTAARLRRLRDAGLLYNEVVVNMYGRTYGYMPHHHLEQEISGGAYRVWVAMLDGVERTKYDVARLTRRCVIYSAAMLRELEDLHDPLVVSVDFQTHRSGRPLPVYQLTSAALAELAQSA